MRNVVSALSFMSRIKGHGPLVPPAGVDPDSVVTVFRVPPENAGLRLDRFMHGQLRRTSRTRTQFIIDNSAFDGHGRRLKSNHRVQPEEMIYLWRAPWDETPVPTDIPVLWEDEHLLAVSKPPNLPVHPSARYHKNTLINLLKAARPDQWLSLGHRLDRETSGVILIGKSPACDRALKRQLEERDEVEKTYTAITWGLPAGMEGGELGSVVHATAKMKLDPNARFSVTMMLSEDDDALTAGTVFTLDAVRHDPDDRTRRYARVSCLLETGRQHQIRLHLKGLGSPIVGDKLYGPDETCFGRGADGELTEEDLLLLEHPRHALHATRLRLRHPITGAALTIEAPLPEDLEDFWAGLVPA